ncbi:N-acetylmuramoyl-L-alanine amidase family protein [Clostridium beijerinckii]|uniref:N-acetylmuramoyl-L-alanine amidase family protein n=1 Tax=Clostridium beijerinckii TaxID=1520 RepID=UPI00149487E1|nr:N-acetylmuramoyl-L-alanine amidase family protein [Clostridium beijerinckii]NOW06628.1 glucan-binding YG repeat protein/uncharacterized protein (UPF0262 family) [Clostridium beijerinckii]NYC00228.1 glucan-binding YG repeat protein/uncharacterized protein (UPF0262 family) [Clostridium beijerinckii]
MIKRLNKIIALMITATSVISFTPAFAKADKLNDSEGDISKAIAYKDGKYLYEGSKNGKDCGVYYNDGKDKETLLSDVSDLDGAVKYEDGYLVLPDSKDETKINLNDGGVKTNEDSRDDKLTAAKAKLKTKLSNTSRYGKNTDILSFKSVSDDTNMFGNQEWYEYTATGNPNNANGVADDEDDGGKAEVNSRITVEINAFYADLTILGQKFSPTWGDTLVKSLEDKIKSADFGSYTIESINSNVTSDAGNTGKITIVFDTAEKLGSVPENFVLFDGKVPTWEATSKLSTSAGNTGGTSTGEVNSRITVEINAFYADLTILGQKFSPAWGSPLVKSLEDKIKAADFGSYKIESINSNVTSDDGSSGKITIVFDTAEKLESVPENFVLFSGNVPTWEATAKLDTTTGSSGGTNTGGTSTGEVNSRITVEINAFYADLTISGQKFSPAWGSLLVKSLEDKIKAADFGSYKIESINSNVTSDDGSSGKITIVFNTAEKLESVPENFVLFGGNVPTWEATAKLDTTTGSTGGTSTEETNETTTQASIKFVAALSAAPEVSNDAANVNSSTSSKNDKVIYYGYADSNGNFIDCSKIANLKVFNGEKTVKISDFNDKNTTESKKDGSNLKVKVGLPTVVATLGQDENYIYSLIDVPIVGSQPENGSSYKSSYEAKVRYVQKISKKSQQAKVSGANIPSSVSSYQLNNNTGWDKGDNWAYMSAYNMIQDSINEFNGNAGIRIVNDILYVAHSKKDDDGDPAVTFGKIKLKDASKVTLINDNDRIITEPLVFEDSSNEGKAKDWCFDVNGNVWAIFDGKIRKSAQARKFQDAYRTDGAFNKISVYDDDDLIAWNSDGDYYSTAKDSKIQSDKLNTTNIKTGWQKAENESWHLYDLSGKDTKGWVNYNYAWYYFNEQGEMQTGWVQVDGKSYYLSDSGVRVTGWKQIGDKWYYFDENGVKQVNTTINGYVLNSDGVWVK